MSNARNLARLLPNASGQLPDAAMASGSVLQVVNGKTSTAVVSTATGVWIDTGITATITPLSASNKILVMFNLCGLWKNPNNHINRAAIRMLRGSQSIGLDAYSQISTEGTALQFRSGGLMYSVLDAPNTTSPVTYKLQFMCEVVSANDGIAVQKDGNSGESQIHLMEIAA